MDWNVIMKKRNTSLVICDTDIPCRLTKWWWWRWICRSDNFNL